MRVMLSQQNPTVGDGDGNWKIMRGAIDRAMEQECDVLLLSEMFTVGYPPRDFLYFQKMWDNQRLIAENVQRQIKRLPKNPLTVIFGGIQQVDGSCGSYSRYNVAYIVDAYETRTVSKRLLPCYDVFDERRYFVPGKDEDYRPIAIRTRDGKVNCDVLICEDIWNAGFNGDMGVAPSSYDTDPTNNLKGNGPLFVLNASPFWVGKIQETIDLVDTLVKRLGRSVCWCNQVGAHDDLVFGGYSMVTSPSTPDPFTGASKMTHTRLGKLFAEDEFMVVLGEIDELHPLTAAEIKTRKEAKEASDGFGVKKVRPLPAFHKLGLLMPEYHGKQVERKDFDMWCITQALTLHIKDYCRRCGFKDVILGLSGGIDSAAVAVLAEEALGSENVTAITMPSKYSSDGSVSDSQILADRLKIQLLEIPIKDIHQTCRDSLLSGGKQKFDGPLTDENIQPRARMMILMALSNENGSLLLTTGNKSEISVGYCTLYGDMAGGLAVISDVWKTDVFDLCRFFNKYRGAVVGEQGPLQGELVPAAIIDKPPSAELRKDQRDDASLPPYETLDHILKIMVENNATLEEVKEQLMREDRHDDMKIAEKIDKLYRIAEYKRSQMPCGPKISKVAFGSGRRRPIASKFTVARALV